MIENWTPHTINVYSKDGKQITDVFEPCGMVVREDLERQASGMVYGFECFKTISKGVSNAPPVVSGKYYIVSAQARISSGRHDLISPSDFVRDEKGNILGCKFFDVN